MVETRVAALRLVFFGTPQFAIPSLGALVESPHRVVAVVTQPDRPRDRGQRSAEPPVKRLAQQLSIPVLQPTRLGDAGFLEELRSLSADLGIVVAYGKLLPESVLQLFRHGLINVHASLLPRYRGAAPIQRAIIAGERETGITIMQIVKELDAGPMLAQIVRTILPDETGSDLEAALAEIGARALMTVIEQIIRGTTRPVPQVDAMATYAPRLTKDEGLIDWNRPAESIHNTVRGLHPWPHAYSYLDGQRYIILRTQISDSSPDHAPGTVIESHGDRLTIAAGDGRLLRVLQLQPTGRRPMTAREFLAGHRLPMGARFSQSPG